MAAILIVDDDKNLRSIMRIILEKKGHTVVEACDGVEGVEISSKQHFDLLITDIIMPEKEGIQTIIEIRRKFPDLKIIAVSGGGRSGADDYLEAAQVFGADYALAKPFDTEEFLWAVNELLQQKQAI